MKSKNIKILCFLLLMLSGILAACGKENSTTSIPASLAMKGTSGNAVNMNGTWKVCTHDSGGNLDELITYTLSGGTATMQLSQWGASASLNCTQTTAPDALFTATASYSLGAEAPASWTDGGGSTSPPAGIASNAKATAASYVLQSIVLTPNSALAANYFNSTATCGKTDWAVGVPRNILNCTDIIPSTTGTDYWVVDDSAAVLKWYAQDTATAPYQVDSVNPMLK